MCQDDFIECPTCAAKSGNPTLCNACLQNRATIGRLRDRVDQLETTIRVIGEVSRAAQNTRPRR